MQLTHIPTLTLLSVLLFPQVLAQKTQYPPCLDDCIKKNLASSWCDGDETGVKKDQCTCDTYTMGAANRAVACVRTNCSKEEQVSYASNIPALCRGTLFPGLEVPTGTTTTDSTPTGTAGAANGAATSSAAAVPFVGNMKTGQLVVVGGVAVAMFL